MSLQTTGALGIVTILLLLFLASAQAAIPPSERDALIAFYDSTNGDAWSVNTNWRQSPGVFSDPGTECTWFGVTCDSGETTVEKLVLVDNQLTGNIPAELAGLPNLRSLSLISNQLTGAIPPDVGNLANLEIFSVVENRLSGAVPPELGNLAELANLGLGGNQLTGAIPPELGDLSNLRSLDLFENQLTGVIPPELGNLANLQELLLENNQLTGAVPPELGNLADLLSLSLFRNQLEGSIPPELGNLGSLGFLGLDYNQLKGPIPPELGNLTNLQRLSLHHNQLTGAIPRELGNLTNLQDLFLEDNQLTGAIPPELGNLGNLEFLNLEGNQLMGAIPASLGDLANLEFLRLDRNQLTGAIPPELGNLANLQILRFTDNQLTGEIPPGLGNLANLQSLHLGVNQLTGSIPPELGNLTNLEFLFLSDNRLTGEIPPELGNLAGLLILFLGNNQLTGAVPVELGQLSNLLEGRLDLRFNHLFTDNNSLRQFLNSKQRNGDWESFQTLRRYFAQFGDGGGLFSQIVLFSLNDVSAATGQLEILGASGDALTVDLNSEVVVGVQEISVPAAGLLSLRTDGQGDVQQGSVRVTTDRHVEGVVIFGGGFGLAGVGSSPAFASSFVAPMQRNENLGTNTGIAVTALSGEGATLDFSLLDGDGNAIAGAAEMLVANGHAALFVTDIEWDAPVDFSDFSGTLVVTASQPVTATVIQTRPGEFVTLPAAPLEIPRQQLSPQGLAPAAERRLFFAQFADGAGAVSSQILLLNLSEEASANVQITLRDDPGEPLTVDLAGQQVTGEMQLEIAPQALRVLATDGEGDLQEGSVTVTADQPLAGVIIFSGPAVGAAGVGSSLELPEGFVAPMERNEIGGVNTGVALMSLEAEETIVEAELLATDGQSLATAQLPLAGMGHDALFVTDFQWDTPIDFSNFEGLLRVRGGGRTAATVIQTRRGQFATMPVAPKPAN